MDDFQKLLMEELKEIKGSVSEIRTTDIPDLKTSVALLKHDASFSSKIHSSIGALVAFVSAYVAMKFDHRG